MMSNPNLSKELQQQQGRRNKKVRNKSKKRTTGGDGNVKIDEEGSPMIEDDRLLPYLLQHLPHQGNNSQPSPSSSPLPPHLQHVPNDLLTKGYSIISSIFSQEECDDAIDQLWDFVCDTSGNMVQRDDPMTWYPNHQLQEHIHIHSSSADDTGESKITKSDDQESDDQDPWPHTGYPSFPDMFQSLGAGFLLGQTRLHLAERVFEPLFGTKELHVSKEGFTFARPTLIRPSSSVTGTAAATASTCKTYKWNRPKKMTTKRVCGKIQENGLGEHYDQSHAVKGIQTIQSSVCFIDQDKTCNDGHFVCIPHSHSTVHTNTTRDIYRGEFSWIPLTQDEVSDVCNKYNLKKEHVFVNAGDVILWRSDLIHAAVPPGEETPHFRAVGYVSMSPANLTPNYPNVWIEKLNAYKFGKTGDHRTFVESWHDHKRLDCSSGVSSAGSVGNDTNWILARQRPFYRYKPPKVTKRLAELYGLIPSNLKTKEEYQEATARATVRGVRFVNDLENVKHLNSLPNQQLCSAFTMQLKLQNNELLLGQDKFLGGVCSPNGNFIYGVPGHAKRVLRVNTQTNSMDLIGPEFPGNFKWLRGVDIPAEVMVDKEDDESSVRNENEFSAGCCIALPSNACSILKINCKTNEVTTFGEIVEKGWLYHGGNLTADGFVYAIPANATRVLKIDPRREKCMYIGPKFDGLQKWFGGVLGFDGMVYGIPQNASGVLKINPFLQECTVIGELGNGMWKWHGGTAINGGKQIIGYPNNADSVLVIDVEHQKVFTVGDKTILKSGRHRIPQDGRYKWLGGAVTLNGKFTYLFPCDAERVLRIDNQTYELSLVGPELLEGENKYQNGFVSKDGALYGIPQRAAGVLRIIPGYLLGGGDDQVDVMYCGDEMVQMKDKFEGGVIDPSGNIYCIPLRSKTLMKVVPTIAKQSM